MSDRYQFSDTELYEIVEEADFTEFRDGQPFTYPAVILFGVHNGKSRVCPKASLDRIARRIPHPIVEVDSFEEFVNCFELATKGKFTASINSYSSEGYSTYKTAVHKWVETYNLNFQEGRLSTESKSMLESFAMMLLVTVEMVAVEKAKTLRPQPEPKE